MKLNKSAYQWSSLVAIVSMLAIALTGCSGSDGSDGPPGPPGPAGTGAVPVSTATSLTINIDSVSINSTPVVNFTVTNEVGVPVTGFADTDLRFNIAKLVPGTNGGPSTWQSYIYRATGGVAGNQERKTTSSGYRFGTLVDHKDGTYTYTFATDITNPADIVCPAPCTDADGTALDLSYQPTLTHRVAIQQGNSAYPRYNATYDFVPAGGALMSREIVKIETCNVCHNQLALHGSRIETKLCVTCHNPGSWVAGTAGVTPNTPVDFKVMVHKIHRGDALPSVVAGVPYKIGNSDFSDVGFPQDIRNCTKCHDGTPSAANYTAQGDNWKNAPSKAACGSCHDDVYFGAAPDPLKPYQTVSHATLSGSADPADGTCLLCHGAGKPEDIAVKHTIPSKVVRGNFKFNILEICGIPVVNGLANTFGVAGCQAGQFPTVKFSVTDPTGGTHGYPSSRYDIFADPEFFNVTPKASLTVDIAWNTRDYTNTDGSQARPGRANQFNVYGTTAATNPYGNASFPAYPAAVSNGDGTYTLTAATPIPASATGSGAMALEGRAFNPLAGLSSTDARVPIKGEVAYFAITDSKPVARRVVADATGKCDNCHDQLALHGGSRNDNIQLCVLCHNPSNTDAQASARPKAANHLPIGDDPVALAALVPPGTAPADGKKEESVDLKRMIHGIHAGDMRENAIDVAGTVFSFGFPGILNDCSTCHTGTTYQLTGIWETPSQNGILGSTIDSVPFSTTGITTASTSAAVDAELNSPVKDLKISPTAAVCSSCHDTALEQAHMMQNGALFASMQSVIGSNYETCAICHGPGALADVKVVHGVK
jgi:OmcA/MtrC family decaheme c-type cytochrome